VIEGHFHGTQTTYAVETLGHRLEAIELGTVPRFNAQDQIRVVIPPDHSWVFPQGREFGLDLRIADDLAVFADSSSMIFRECRVLDPIGSKPSWPSFCLISGVATAFATSA
jgi:hypothetical protein